MLLCMHICVQLFSIANNFSIFNLTDPSPPFNKTSCVCPSLIYTRFIICGIVDRRIPIRLTCWLANRCVRLCRFRPERRGGGVMEDLRWLYAWLIRALGLMVARWWRRGGCSRSSRRHLRPGCRPRQQMCTHFTYERVGNSIAHLLNVNILVKYETFHKQRSLSFFCVRQSSRQAGKSCCQSFFSWLSPVNVSHKYIC